MSDLYTYNARVIRVVDGDTYDMEIDLGLSIFQRVRVRLAGGDTPEVYGVKKDSAEYAAGVAASDFVRDMIEGKDVIVRTVKDKKGKYGRYLVYVYPFGLDGDMLHEVLALNGLLKD